MAGRGNNENREKVEVGRGVERDLLARIRTEGNQAAILFVRGISPVSLFQLPFPGAMPPLDHGANRASAAVLVLWQHAELTLNGVGDLAGPGKPAAIRGGAHGLFFRLTGAGSENEGGGQGCERQEDSAVHGANIKQAPGLASPRSLGNPGIPGSVRIRLREDHPVAGLQAHTGGEAVEIDLGDRLGGFDR